MNIVYYLFAFISGLALTTQVGINSTLLSMIKSPILTALISFSIGTLGLALTYILMIFLKVQDFPLLENITQTSWWMWAGGLLGSFYIFTAVFTAPKIGFASMFSLVIAGQILLAIIFDHWGLLGTILHPLTYIRGVGVFFLVVGVYLIEKLLNALTLFFKHDSIQIWLLI